MEIQPYQNILRIADYLNNHNMGSGVCECPLCKATFPAFIKTPPNYTCPNCKSRERHRELGLVMDKVNWYHKGMRVLHFAPEQVFHKLFSSFADIDYWSVDLNPNSYKGKIRKAVDITNISFDDNSFDLIMCMHVLEHIPDDRKAMSELYRVLKPNGIAFLNVPLFQKFLENPEYNTPELRAKYYGQFDHVRAYNFDVYSQRLIDSGFVDIKVFTAEGTNEEILERYGLRKHGKTFLCRKE